MKTIHVTLGEVLSVKRGMSLAGDNYATEGIYKRLTLANFDYNNHCFQEDKGKEDIYYNGNIKPECILPKGAIITPLTEQVRGLLGETARIPCSNTYIQSGDIGLITPIPSKLDDLYAFYLVSSPVVKKQLDASSQQTKIRHTSPDAIMACEAWIPEDIAEQHKIGLILDSINEKIALNNSIFADLEAIAKQIYDYWFVQFDFPDENGKPYKSSGGKMVWCEKLNREIPEGWEVKKTGEYIDITRGVSYQPTDVSDIPKDGYVALLKSNNLQNDHLVLSDVIYVPKGLVDKTQILNNNSIFVTMSSGSTEHVGKTALIPFDTEYCFGAFCSKISIKPSVRCFISMFFLSDYFKSLIRTLVIGTSIKNISNEHLLSNSIAVPSNGVLKAFEDKINPVFDKLGSVIKENLQLTSLRDFLLPMLMNGQIKIGA